MTMAKRTTTRRKAGTDMIVNPRDWPARLSSVELVIVFRRVGARWHVRAPAWTRFVGIGSTKGAACADLFAGLATGFRDLTRGRAREVVLDAETQAVVDARLAALNPATLVPIELPKRARRGRK
jgi:hypothetical protein